MNPPATDSGEPPQATPQKKTEKRVLPAEATVYWAESIESYSLAPDPGLFGAAKGYSGLVAVFDEALPEGSREAVVHMRALDALGVVCNHYFENYSGKPPTPLYWWVQHKLGLPSSVVVFDGHVATMAEGPGAEAELDEALGKTAREFDRKNGFWGYGVAREEVEPGRFRQTVVFSEKRLLLEDFPKFYEPGSMFRLKGRVPGPDRGLRLEVRGGEYTTSDLQIDAEGNFSIDIRLPLKKGVGLVSIDRPKTATVPGQGFLFLKIYIGVPEPAVPDQDDFFNAGVPPQHMCANFQPVPPPGDDAGELPDRPTYVQREAALAAVAEKIKACNGIEGGAIDMTFDIDGSGQVRSAGAFGALNGTSLDLCVSRALCDARFPPFKRDSLIMLMGFEL